MRPIPVNFFVLVVSTVSLAVVAAPLSLLHLWPLGFAMTWAAVAFTSPPALRSPGWSPSPPTTTRYAPAGWGVSWAPDLHRPSVHGRIRGGHRRHGDRRADGSRPARRLRGGGWLWSHGGWPMSPNLTPRRWKGPPARRFARRPGRSSLCHSSPRPAGASARVMIQLAERSTAGASTTMMVLGEGLGVAGPPTRSATSMPTGASCAESEASLSPFLRGPRLSTSFRLGSPFAAA